MLNPKTSSQHVVCCVKFVETTDSRSTEAIFTDRNTVTWSNIHCIVSFEYTTIALKCCEHWVERRKQLQCLRNGSDLVAWKALNTWNWMQQTCWKHVRWFPPISFSFSLILLLLLLHESKYKGGIEVSKMVFFAVFWWNSLKF